MNTKLVVAALLAIGSAPSFSQVDSVSQTAESSPNVIEAVECRGNVRTSCDYIRRKLELSVDARIDDEAVKSARLRLSALPIFESVFLRLEKGSEKGKAILIVEVVEASSFATELTAGIVYETADYLDDFPTTESETLFEQISGRISNQNLFGRQKIASLGVAAAHNFTSNDTTTPFGDFSNDGEYSSASLNASYIDPALGGVDRLFLSAGASYSYARVDGENFNPSFRSEVEIKSNSLSVNLSVGSKFWDYAFVLAGYSYATHESEQKTTYANPSPVVQILEDDGEFGLWRLGLGWDSEDDAYFPTRGIRVSLFGSYSSDREGVAEPQWSAAYKQTWSQSSGAAWTINVGGEPGGPADRLRPALYVAPGGLAVMYARSTSPISSTDEGGRNRGRWYVQLSTGPVEISREGRIGGHPTVAAAKVGLRWETKILGVVDLYAVAIREWRRYEY